MATILFVEKEKNLRLLYAKELTDEGFAVLTCSSGIECLKHLESAHVDLAVLSVRLDDMSGFELLEFIIERHPKMPVIIQTSVPTYRTHQLAYLADAFVDKTVDLTELKVKVRELLAMRE